MKNLEKLQKIEDIIISIYRETIDPSCIEELAKDIYDCAYTDGYDLIDIVIELLDMVMYNWDKAYDVFYEVVDLMENNALTAKKLYHCFLESYVDFNVLCKLLNWNEEWLTPDEKKNVKETAKCFDKELLKNYIYNWDDED